MDTFEKKYNEALKDMMVIYPNLKGDAKLAVEHAFPELRESEDERIRKIITGSVFYQYGADAEYKDVLDYLDKLEKQKEQKPAEWEDYKDKVNIPYCSSEPEWSEEDEKMLEGIIERGQAQVQWCDTGLRPEQVSWLKSLRPSWKPSEEQMAWLKLAIDEAKEPLKSQLEELYKNIRENLIWK